MRNNLIILGLVGIAVFVVLSRNEQVAATGDLDRFGDRRRACGRRFSGGLTSAKQQDQAQD